MTAPASKQDARDAADATPLRAHLAAALRRPATWLALLFAATSGAGFEAAGALAGPFLVDRGLTDGEIGVFLGVPAVAAMALGALAGGRLADRAGLRRTTFLAGLAVGAAVLALAGLARAGADDAALLVALGAVYLGLGVFTAASYALFMALTDPALGATQFSAYMGATNLCESWSARVAGALAAGPGYASAFAWPAAAGLASLPLLALLGRRRRPGDPLR